MKTVCSRIQPFDTSVTLNKELGQEGLGHDVAEQSIKPYVFLQDLFGWDAESDGGSGACGSRWINCPAWAESQYNFGHATMGEARFRSILHFH